MNRTKNILEKRSEAVYYEIIKMEQDSEKLKAKENNRINRTKMYQ